MSVSPKLRSLPDRIRQIALFELGGLLLITPPFMWLSGVTLRDSIGMLASIAVIAALWNGTYNTCFDWIGWLASIPGIPADWGNQLADLPEDGDPLPLAA